MTTDSIWNLSAANYEVTITDASGCMITSQYEVLSPEILELVVNTTNVSTPGGSDGSASAVATGGTPAYNYLWSTGQTTNAIQNLSAGNYSVVVTDDHDCSKEIFFTIAEPGCGLTAQVITSAISCAGGSNGTATVEYVGGNGNVEFLWSNGETSQTISDLPAGTYLVTVYDNGCTVFSLATLIDPPSILAETDATPTNCNDSTGSTSVIASGGTGLLTYLWSTGESTPLIENLSQGIYTVTVTDVNACTNVQSADGCRIG
jgi:hypothetical protein